MTNDSSPSQIPDDVQPRAKTLPTRLPVAGSPPELVPARMVNEVLYCERLMYLEWAQGEFADNAFTVEGRFVHRRADKPGPPLAPETNERPYTARSVWLSSSALALTARIDVVEVDGGAVVPIEYKRGKQPDLPDGAYLPERAQLCAQVLLLREHGYRCDEAAIYFAGDHQRVAIRIDDELVTLTRRAVARAHEITAEAQIPPPLCDSPKCNGCSLIGICLPDETNALASAPEPAAKLPELRRLHPARDDRVPFYVQRQGGKIGLDGDCLRLRARDEPPVEARLANTSQIVLLGNVQISTQALRRSMQMGIPVSFFTYGGWYVGRALGHDSNNVELRVAQYAAAQDRQLCLKLARGFVRSKIGNCRTLLRRNHRGNAAVALSELRQLRRKSASADCLATLLGLEGTAARAYFGAFTGMLADDARLDGFELEGRNRRPPRDPLNAMLSFCYALLTKDLAVALAAVGLDPLLGFYHQPRFGRPALALDLMEEFRPLAADSTVVSAINNGVVTSSDFIRGATGVALKQPARRRLILAYERRMDQLITHPVFGYRISYRRVLEVQARLLGRKLLGELDDYPAFTTR